MDRTPEVVDATGAIPDSPARTRDSERPVFTVGAVQQSWNPDRGTHLRALREGVEIAVERGARLVCLQELTLSPYFAIEPDDRDSIERYRESIPDGPTSQFAIDTARELGVHVHASLYEEVEGDDLGFNTAICASPAGELIARTRKIHIPVTAGYHEDRYFRSGDSGFPVVEMDGARVGFPTCWDQWFPELARAYSLGGADLIVYPTAIGSEPDHPSFDTEPLWSKVIVANGIANGTFMIAINRIGTEGPITFYGSSFISDPYGRVLARAPRDRPAVLVADLDLDQRRDWLELFPFLGTRRPEAYGPLTERKD